MSTEQNQAVLRRLEENANVLRRVVEEMINGKNLDVAGELFAPDFVEHEELPGMPSGIEGTKLLFGMLHTAFPDIHGEIEDVVAQDDKVVFRMTWRGTQTGDFMGIPATGKQVEFAVWDLVRVADGKIAEHWGLLDMMRVMQQLGVIPSQASAPA